MKNIKKAFGGAALCFAIAAAAWQLGKLMPVVGGAVFSLLIGMAVSLVIHDKTPFAPGLRFVSKKVLQWAVILLGFGLDLTVVLQTGRESLPIIVATIATALVLAAVFSRVLGVQDKVAVLVGVGSSICGGSAIAATSPVIHADDKEVAQSISVIFFFNALAALIFPSLGAALGFSTVDGHAFGLFAGTAVNDTSSVTAAASTWDSMWALGSDTLDVAVTVKLTRTLAIIPITILLSYIQTRKGGGSKTAFSLKNVFPYFIFLFIAASLITTVAAAAGVGAEFFTPFKTLSKFMIVLAMAAIGVDTNIVELIRTGKKPLLLGFICWVGISTVSILMQRALNLM